MVSPGWVNTPMAAAVLAERGADIAGAIPLGEGAPRPHIQRIVVRDLTPDTEGNANGIGMADIALRQAIDKIDPIRGYMNAITSKCPQAVRVPLTVDTDRQALFIALASCMKIDVETARIARIEDTKHVERLWVSEPLLPEMLASGRVEQTGDLVEIAFDADGMLPPI